MNRGKKAVKSGQYGENTFEGAIIPYVPDIVWFNDFRYKDLYPGPYPDDLRLAVRQYHTKSPFNGGGKRSQAKNDFMIFGGETIFCQVKNQNEGGTTDEKIVAAFKMAQYALTTTPYDRFLLVLLGIHWSTKERLIQWAREVAAPKMELGWATFGGKVSVDIAHGPVELAKILAEYKERGIL